MNIYTIINKTHKVACGICVSICIVITATIFNIHLSSERLVLASIHDSDLETTMKMLQDEGYNIYYTKRGISIKSKLMNGPFYVKDNEGNLILQGNYKDGKWEGLIISIHENGQVESIEHYRGGRPDKIAVQWDRQGRRIRETRYDQGSKNGIETYWDQDGHITQVGRWKDGDIVELTIYENNKIVKIYDSEEANAYMKSIATKMMNDFRNEAK